MQTGAIFYVLHDEDSLRKRRAVQRGYVGQEEFLHTVTATTLDIKDKKRLHYQGHTRGTGIYPVAVPEWEYCWLATEKDKIDVFGPHRVPVGGSTDNADKMPFFGSDEDLVPVNWHSRSIAFYEELIHSFGLKVVVHLTCLDELFAMACLRQKVACCCVVFSDYHCELLHKRLCSRIFESFQEDGPLYEPQLANLLAGPGKTKKKQTAASSAENPKKQPKTGAKGVAKGKAKGKAKLTKVEKAKLLKKLKKAGEAEESAEEPEEESAEEAEEESADE